MIQLYRKVYQMLEDDESRDIYINRLNYMVTGDSKYMRHIINSYSYGLDVVRAVDMRTSMPADRQVILYGAGDIGRQLFHIWQADSRFAGFCSGNEEQQRNGYFGYPVISPAELLSKKEFNVIISVRLPKAKAEIKRILRDGGYPENQIFHTDYLIPEDPYPYFGPDFMTCEDEIFIDAGCFDLSSSLELRRRCRHLKKVYAFEPDPKNYQKCLERKEETGFHEAEIFPLGLWSKRDTLLFCADGTEGAHICQETPKQTTREAGTDCAISVVPMDEIVDPADEVTTIKMDLEGAELEALKGARHTIVRCKPKLAISIYHKPEDMWILPLYVKELAPEYRLYIRHHSIGQWDTVLYAVMPERS